MSTFNGTITAPAADKSHTGLQDKTFSGPLASGSTSGENVGTIANTGNVSQTVNLAISGAVNCTVTLQVVDTVNGAEIALPVSIPANKQYNVNALVSVTDMAPGSTAQSYSFDVTETWS
jgi:hypothetical protein